MTTLLTSEYAYMTDIESYTKTIDIVLTDKRSIESVPFDYEFFHNVKIIQEDHRIIFEGTKIRLYRVFLFSCDGSTSIEKADKLGLIWKPSDVITVGWICKEKVLKEGTYEYKTLYNPVRIESTLPYTITYLVEKK